MTVKKANETAIEEFANSIGHLVRKIRASAPTELKEITWTQKSVISRLDREGPATSAELARAESVKPQSMAVAVAQLEKLGIVERKPHPTDKRQMNIKLTAKGVAFRKRTKAATRTWLAVAIEKLDSREQATLFHASEIIKNMVYGF